MNAAPVLYLTPHGGAGLWPFHLFSARVEWPAGGASQGWGRDEDPALAQRKALAEAVERHAYTRLPEGARLARACDLGPSLHPDSLVRYEEAQYASPGFPCARYDPGGLRWWVTAFAAEGGGEVAVPADFVCTRSAFDSAYGRGLLTHPTSSGCASGASLDDAILRGTLELLERDAFMRHWFAQLPGDVVKPSSLPGWCVARLESLRSLGCAAGVQCLTLGMHPTFMTWTQHRRMHFTCIGAGAALDAESALRTAMDEMETLVAVRLHAEPAAAMRPEDARSPADHGALYASEAFFAHADAVLRAPSGAVRFGDVALACRMDASALYAGLRHRGHPAHAVDLSVPEAGTALDGAPLHSVRMLAPGLIPMAFGQACQPFGMVAEVAEGGRFPHPFP